MRLPWWLPVGRVPEMKAKDLEGLRHSDPGLQIVDVRTAGEYERGHIPGATSLPIQSFQRDYPNLGLDPDRPVAVICRTAHRSVPAVRLLNSKGYDAFQLAKGMNAWWNAGLPTTNR